MLGKKVIIMSFPRGTNKVRRYCFPKRLPILYVCFSLLAITGLSVFSYYTYNELTELKRKEADAAELRHKASQADVQLYAFEDKIRLLEQEMSKLRQFNRKLRVMTEQAPITGPTANTGMGGSAGEATNPRSALKGNTSKLVREMHKDLDRLLAEASVHELSQHQIGRALEDSRSIMASTPVDWPCKGPVTSYFGYRKNPFGGARSEFHRGLDIAGPTGTPITAPADGEVVSVEWNSGYGLILVLNHGYGVVTRYAHLSEAFVEAGMKVKKGQKVCAMGSSGRVTGPHLHYEVIVNGIPVNPMRYIAQKD